MKKKIEEILYNCSEEVFLNLGESTNCVDRELAANAIAKLFPRPRFPEKDGWPLDPNESALCMHKSGELKLNYNIDYERCGQPIPNNPVVWYIPIDEIINLVEGNQCQ